MSGVITFSAKKLHDNPSEVYRAANRGPVVITHKHHGKLVLCSIDDFSNAGLSIVPQQEEAKEASE